MILDYESPSPPRGRRGMAWKRLGLCWLALGLIACEGSDSGGLNLGHLTLVSQLIPGRPGDRLVEDSLQYGASSTESIVHIRTPDGFYTYALGEDGAHPEVTSSYGVATGGEGQELSRHGPYLYYRDGIARTHVFSLLNPREPVELGLVDRVPYDTEEFVGTFEYRNDPSDFDLLEVLDVSDPLHAVQVGSLRVSGLVGIKSLRGQLLLGDATGVGIYTLSDPVHPMLLRHLDVPGTMFLHKVFPSGHVWLFTARGEQTVSVEPAASAHLVGAPLAPPGGVDGLYSRVSSDGRYWFLATEEGERRTRTSYDMNDPSAPRIIGTESSFLDDTHTTQADARFVYVTGQDAVHVFRP